MFIFAFVEPILWCERIKNHHSMKAITKLCAAYMKNFHFQCFLSHIHKVRKKTRAEKS